MVMVVSPESGSHCFGSVTAVCDCSVRLNQTKVGVDKAESRYCSCFVWSEDLRMEGPRPCFIQWVQNQNHGPAMKSRRLRNKSDVCLKGAYGSAISLQRAWRTGSDK